MNSKQLADTQVSLPELALGTWGYTGGVEPLRAGIELGATFIDTAEDYGTEEVVGGAIRGMRQKVFVATKVAPRNFRRADLIRSAEQSLNRLGTDYIDLYQLHWPNYLVPIAEPMAAMEELVAAGKVRYIGVSNFSVKELERAQACLSKNRIVSNQVRYNLIDRTIEYGLMQYCEAKKITILAYSPLSRGFQTIRMFDSKDLLGSVASETGKTRSQVALNWCTSHAPVVAIFKANRAEHIRENCGASGWRLNPAQMGTLNRVPSLRRGPVEQFAWRLARRLAQRFGKSL
jgi:diketogulonate reductase-like aldo/keto reductase